VDAGAGQPAATYHVRLGFVAPAGEMPGQRVFDIRLQGQVVQENCDVAQLAGGANQAVVLEFQGIPVSSSLVLELTSKRSPATEATAPDISFIEVRRW
jgi:hypothetical protein